MPPSGKRLFAIVNPVSRKGRARAVWPSVRQILQHGGVEVHEAVSEARMHAWELATQAAADGYDVVVSVGGDGTNHEVVNGLLRADAPTPPALGLIPAGTANDLARCLRVPFDPAAAARLLLNGARRRIDIGQVNDRFYATISGVGFDAEVARLVNHWPRYVGGTLLYIAGIVTMLVRFSPVESEITIDGRSQTAKMFLLAAANTNWYAGGMFMAPHARIDDGLLAVVWAEDLGKAETLAVLPKLFSGAHLKHPKVFHTTAREVQVTSATPLAIHADGESVGTVPAHFRIIPLALEVIAPGVAGLGAASPQSHP
ncbi:MAG TPA: diacylglycerol kinase family protein [bacterium]